jgi:hypothetical protein
MNEGDTDQRREAAAAIRAMGNRAIPHLIARLAPRDGRHREFLRWLDRHTPSMRAGLPDRHISVEAERGYAASALGVIGPAAKAAVPALLTASLETNSFYAVRAKAALIQIRREPTDELTLPRAETGNLTNWLERAEILLALGSNIQASADTMVAAIGTNTAEEFKILEELGRNNRDPDASVMLLRGLLKDSNWGIRMNALNMLIMQRAFARPARPDILQCTNDTNAGVRANADYALLFAFPKQPTSTGARGSHSPQPK